MRHRRAPSRATSGFTEPRARLLHQAVTHAKRTGTEISIWESGSPVHGRESPAEQRPDIGVGQSFAARKGMGCLYQLAQSVAEDVRVNLGRGDVGMTQHLLDAAQIGAVVEQMAGEGMAQHVRR